MWNRIFGMLLGAFIWMACEKEVQQIEILEEGVIESVKEVKPRIPEFPGIGSTWIYKGDWNWNKSIDHIFTRTEVYVRDTSILMRSPLLDGAGANDYHVVQGTYVDSMWWTSGGFDGVDSWEYERYFRVDEAGRVVELSLMQSPPVEWVRFDPNLKVGEYAAQDCEVIQIDSMVVEGYTARQYTYEFGWWQGRKYWREGVGEVYSDMMGGWLISFMPKY